MGRPPRLDPPDSWHHVWGRGIGKRSIFETHRDIEAFEACIARAVRREEIEVHGFVFMTTHFHLLVRSRNGRLSEAMRRVLNEYTRYFNRTRDRDGTVWRGRFLETCGLEDLPAHSASLHRPQSCRGGHGRFARRLSAWKWSLLLG